MQPNLSQQDTLQHIEYDNPDLDRDDPSLLINRISSPNGQIVIVSAFGCSLVLNYSFSINDLHADVTLVTPVGSVRIINADLTPSNPSITLGGSIDGFKAEASVSFDFSSMNLTASGEVCAPLVGCKRGSVVIHV